MPRSGGPERMRSRRAAERTAKVGASMRRLAALTFSLALLLSASALELRPERPAASAVRRQLLGQECDLPDFEEWCPDIPLAQCNITGELGELIRGTCPTTCQTCLDDSGLISQNKLLQLGETIELRTGFLLPDPSLSPYARSVGEGWDLWLERSGALEDGIPVGNGRVKIKHTTKIVPIDADCDEYYAHATSLIQDHKIEAGVITTHNCKTNISKTYHEAGVVHFLLSGTAMADGDSLYSNKHAWYIYFDSTDYPRLFLKTMAQKAEKLAVVWWSGNEWTSSSAEYTMDNFVSQYDLELVYNWGWPPNSGGVQISGSSEDGSYVEMYNTSMWDNMLTEMAEAGAEILVVHCRGEGVSIMKRIKALGLNFKGIFMSVTPATAAWPAHLGSDGDFVTVATQWHHELQSPCVLFGDSQQYSAEYEERFGTIPNYAAAAGTASGLALQLGMQTFGSLEQILGGLQTVSEDTMFGRMKFSYAQRNIGRIPVSLQRHNTNLTMVFPEELISGSSALVDMVNWECRELYFDEDQEVCTGEELEQFQGCKELYPDLENSGCQTLVDSQAEDRLFSTAGLAALIVGINAMCCLAIFVYFFFVRRRSAARFKIDFTELVLESEQVQQVGVAGVASKLEDRNKLHATWRGTQVLLIRRPKLPIRTSVEEASDFPPPTGYVPSLRGRVSTEDRRSCDDSPGSSANGAKQLAFSVSPNREIVVTTSLVPPPGQAWTSGTQPGQARMPFLQRLRTCFGLSATEQYQGGRLASSAADVAQLRHPNLLTVLGVTVEPSVGAQYLVVESMALGCLRDCLQTDYANVLDSNTVQYVLKDVVAGVQFLHESKTAIVHGGIRSKNILLDDKLTAKVRTDVNVLAAADSGGVVTHPNQHETPRKRGIKRITESRSSRNITLHTAWTAPEVLAGGPESTMSDIYALGVTIWELFSRQDPYEQQGVKSPLHLPSSVVHSVVNQEMRPTLPAEMPNAIRDLVTRCWHSEPTERPSITEVSEIVNRERVAPLRPMQQELHLSRNLLHQMLPPHVAAALSEGRKVEPEHFNCVTIFFSDIVGYTDISATLPPQKVMSLLDRLYHEFDKLTKTHGLFKVETIGDAYMCVGGLPVAQVGHTARVAKFALEAVAVANSVPIDEENPDQGFVNIRAGFHSGPVVASVVGDLNPRYCLFGDTVNCAARMESNSEANRINMSTVAYLLLKAQCKQAKVPFCVEDRGKIEIKGKGHMRCCFLEDMEMPGEGWKEPVDEGEISMPMAQLSISTNAHTSRVSLRGDVEGLEAEASLMAAQPSSESTTRRLITSLSDRFKVPEA